MNGDEIDPPALEISLENDKTQMLAMDHLVSRGVSPIIAAGFVANADSESGGKYRWNPRVRGDNGRALGIFQWQGERQKALLEFAKALGQNWHSRACQLDFALHEVGLYHGPGTDPLPNALPGFMMRQYARPHIMRAVTAYECGAMISKYFEGPREQEKQMRLRGDKAEKILRRWQEGKGAKLVEEPL